MDEDTSTAYAVVVRVWYSRNTGMWHVEACCDDSRECIQTACEHLEDAPPHAARVARKALRRAIRGLSPCARSEEANDGR